MDPTNSPEISQSQPNRKRRDHSEWLEKALEEGGSRKRRSKKISDPDFVFSIGNHIKDQSDASPTSTQDIEVGSTASTSSTSTRDTTSLDSSGVLNLDFENMTHYEKFFKYKKEYKEYRMRKKEEVTERRSILSSEESSPPQIEPSSDIQESIPSPNVRGKGRPRGRGSIGRGSSTHQARRESLSTPRSLRNSPRVQKISETVSSTKLIQTEDDNQSNHSEILQDIENIEHLPLEKDKYCWYCHKEVVENREKPNVDEKRCKSCYKVFHVRCHPMQSECEGEDWECKPCIQLRELKNNDLWAPYVEYLGYDKYILQIRYIIDNAKKYPSAKEFLHPVNTHRFPDYLQYIAHPVDFEIIEQRVKDGEYRSVDILYEDFKWMFHNSVVFNGTSSAITKDFRGLLKYLRMDLYDLDSCACCYIHAYTRPEAWFILPCPSPHLLVWAQLKGFPHWPAKVYDSHLEQRPGEILVKFFGDHARSWIPYEHIYLYSLDPPSSCASNRRKKKLGMIPSLVEMDTHIELLKKQFGAFKYPEQNIRIGKTVEERALQLKNMIPSCTSCLPKEPCAAKYPSRVPDDSNGIPEAIPDLNDVSSKLSLLSQLEKRLQQGRSDSEDSVKSFGKSNKKTSPSKSNSKALRGVRCRLFFKVLQKNINHARKTQYEKLENIKKRKTSRTQKKSTSTTDGNKTNYQEKLIVQIQDDSKKRVSNEENNVTNLDINDSQSTSVEMNPNDKINKNTLEVKEHDSTKLLKAVENVDNLLNVKESSASIESSISSQTVSPKLDDNNKPQCKDIDIFIENHLASSQQTCEWDDTSNIPPILMPRDKRPVLTPPAKKMLFDSSRIVENNHESQNFEQTHSDNKKVFVNKLNKEKKLSKKSLELKQRLFRHKKYVAQLFEFRKLSHIMNESIKKTQKVSASLDHKSLMVDNISKYFKLIKVKIMNPSVVLNNLTINEIRELKRTVKLKKNPKHSRMNLQDRPKSIDSGFVPIEDTMRISTESEDINNMSCDVNEPATSEDILSSVIDQVANGDLASNLEFGKLNNNRRQQKFPFRWRPEMKALKHKQETDEFATSFPPRIPSFISITNEHYKSNLKHQSEDKNWKNHISQLMKSLEIDPSQVTAKKAQSMIADVEKLKKMAESLFGQDLDEQSKISEDTQYSTALNSAELVLYAEYAAEYDLPELTPADYDMEYEDDM